jgi:hypothetical protein
MRYRSFVEKPLTTAVHKSRVGPQDSEKSTLKMWVLGPPRDLLYCTTAMIASH